jgi:hypothetical protein
VVLARPDLDVSPILQQEGAIAVEFHLVRPLLASPRGAGDVQVAGTLGPQEVVLAVAALDLNTCFLRPSVYLRSPCLPSS